MIVGVQQYLTFCTSDFILNIFKRPQTQSQSGSTVIGEWAPFVRKEEG